MAGRVLSIQSHVVFGYVGNKSATFPLQLLGFEVDAINSVQFSNHTGYAAFRGQILRETDLDDLIYGLALNDLDTSYTHLLTGYVKDNSFLNSVVKTIQRLKQKNPDLVFVCDPVLGDGGELYVPKELIPTYRDSVIPLADVLTPNQSELQFLTGRDVNTFDNLLKAIDILHTYGCKIVVVTSAEFPENKDQLTVVASGGGARGIITIPKFQHRFTGTGDLFSALFLAWLTKLKGNMCGALENTVSTVLNILDRTIQECKSPYGDHFSVKNLELKLIQSKEDIENPKIIYKCKHI